MVYLNGISREKFAAPNFEDNTLMDNDTDGRFTDADYSVRVEASREILYKRFQYNNILGCNLNIIGNTMHKCENPYETILDS